MKDKTMLIILDGYGLNENEHGNAVFQANTKYLDSLFEKYPHARLKTNGKDVGLPSGVMGNSEVGHLNIGAGRIIFQLNTLIDHKIETGEFFSNEALVSAINHAKKYKSKIHLLGLLSTGGVHSSMHHLDALLDLFKRENFNDVYYHVFMDGRDTLQTSGYGFMTDYLKKVKKYGFGEVASLQGRYYGMDRDTNWDRVEKGYNAIVNGIGKTFSDPLQAIQTSYDNGKADEHILPVVITKNDKPVATVEDNDAIIFFNFRSDRPREITQSFIFPDFDKFKIKNLNNLKYVTMTEYDAHFNDYLSVAFRLEHPLNILGEIIQNNEMSQIRLAETEKYAHVTFFFNGTIETPFKNEDRILIPSPKVATYDLQPEMSAPLVRDSAIDLLNNKNYDVIIINFANCDMVGHTGIFEATKIAVETIDECLSQIVPLAISKGYHVVITADHGNAEEMIDKKGNVLTQHSMNDVPLLIIHNQDYLLKVENGRLADIAPSILKLMNIAQPKEMTGKNLITFC